MTETQWKKEICRISATVEKELRKFRKKCVTQGIVEFVKDVSFYMIKYRGHFVCYLYGNEEDSIKLRAVWSAIKIAEETIEKIEGVKHESN